MMKKAFLIFLSAVLALAALCVIPASAGYTPVQSGSGKVYVYDELDVLSESEEADLTQRLESLSNKYNMDFVFIAVESAGHDDDRRIAFADDFYDYGDYRTDGILYMYEEESTFKYLSTTGKCIYAFDAGEDRGYYDNSAIQDDMLDEIDYCTDRGEYYESVLKFIEKSDFYVDYYVTNGEAYVAPEPPAAYPAGWAAILTGLSAIIAGSKKKKEKNKLNDVKINPYANDYIVKDGVNVIGGNEIFLYSTVSRTVRETSSSSRGGGGGVHTHSGSSGVSHGGGGRH